MKILVTGSGGFIGSAAFTALQAAGHEVIPFDLQDGQDILSMEHVDKAVGSGIDAVYHLAAAADLTKIKTLDDAFQATELNVRGTYNFAHACAKYNVWLIYASTCCVYGNQETHPEYEDTSLPNPSEIYAFTKLAGEEVVRGYGVNFKLPYTILRFATIYGPGMRGALAPYVFLNQAHRGEDITVHGTGEQERTQTYIDDLVEGIVATVSHPESRGHIINLTGSERITVIRMAEDIKKLLNSPSNIAHITDRPFQTYREDPSVEKAKQLLDWYARTPWEEGIKKTAEWFKSMN